METFSFLPKSEVTRTLRYLDRTIDFETGSFQVQKIGVNPIITFEATYEGTKDSIKEIEDFYLRHRKSEKFNYIYDGQSYICQFTSDFNATDTFGFAKNGKIVCKVSVTLSMRVVNI